uniref:Uncharacterized protein n=1 Tax=Anguilla anguilla TaxID=7936 RepID=A0A0E9UNR0_ANGAN
MFFFWIKYSLPEQGGVALSALLKHWIKICFNVLMAPVAISSPYAVVCLFQALLVFYLYKGN